MPKLKNQVATEEELESQDTEEMDEELGDDTLDDKKDRSNRTTKKLRKAAARAAEMIALIANNTEDSDETAIVKAAIKAFAQVDITGEDEGKFEILFATYKHSPDKRAKMLQPLSPEKRAERKAKRAARRQSGL